jgi:hypothetical protein
MNVAEETRCRALKYAVEKLRSLHFGNLPIKSTNGGAARPESSTNAINSTAELGPQRASSNSALLES